MQIKNWSSSLEEKSYWWEMGWFDRQDQDINKGRGF